MALSTDDVAALARLARIELTDDELAHLAPQLDVILESVARVSRRRRRRHPADVARRAADECLPGRRRTSVPAPRGRAGRRPGRRAGPVPGARGSWGRKRERPFELRSFDRLRDQPPHCRRAGRGDRGRRDHRGRGHPGAPGPDRGGRRDVHAFLHVDARAARSRRRPRWMRSAAGEPVGPLAGVPLALKDVFTTPACRPPAARRSSRAGSRRTTPRSPSGCSTPASSSSARPTWTSSRWARRRRTPRTARPATRGTSTGSPAAPAAARAAALAAFEAPLAIGTDTGGSIRQPAAVTGTVGVKPTYGGTSRYGLVAMASRLDQAGPCARTVLDAALLHEVIAGHDPMDSTSIDAAGAAGGGGRPVRAT